MPDAIELIVMCLHAGLTPTQAIGELARVAPAPVRPGSRPTEQRLHRGAGFADALGELTRALRAQRRWHSCRRSARPSATGCRSHRCSTASPTRPTPARRRAGEAAARRLPVRLSFPLVACTLPSFVLLAIAPAVLGALSTVRGSAP